MDVSIEAILAFPVHHPWVAGEECEPIIIREDDKAFYFIFPGMFTDLT